ncbi:MAG: hypothetical protein OEY20_04705 [Gemmatimonadota bacterium]|nr:hypothetical protein [Gemmatimonadota bacterium]MDH4350604.1 hypothetical protein [Gemmatimonadota bacterium]MDH5196529.1 hypothetical protein [Gemmatimonadota bacterium]
MRVSSLLSLATLGTLALLAGRLDAQGYRVELDARVQGVSYRGWQLDSIPIDQVQVQNGLLYTPGGIGVTCLAGQAYCIFYRPGDKVQAYPFAATVDFALWNFGVRGLRFEGSGRLAVDGKAGPTTSLSTQESMGAWPGTKPPAQLIEAYLAYDGPWYALRGGRVANVSRFGYTAFDGAQVRFHEPKERIGVSARYGWALARGALVPWTDASLDPLDEYRPSTRDMLLGFDLDWNLPWLTGRVLYEREWASENSVTTVASELLGGDVALRPHRSVHLSGGLEYDMALGSVGNADGAITGMLPKGFGSVTLGARRYRPRFPLWSIWTAFSPVPYNAFYGQAAVHVLAKLDVRGRVEKYGYDETEAASALMTVETDGWRYGLGATYRHSPQLNATVDYQAGLGVGAQAQTVDLGVNWRARDMLNLRISGAYVERALEFRYSNNTLWRFGLDADAKVRPGLRAFGGAWYLAEQRDRPDAAAFDWNQVRFHIGLRFGFGSAADRPTLPPSILRIPEGGAQ